MATKEMLKFGYKLGQNLGAIGHGIPILIELSDNKAGFNLGYKPTYKQLFQASRGGKKRLASLGVSIPHINVTFLAPIEVIIQEPFQKVEDEEFDLACIIWLYPEEFSVNKIISSKDGSISTIRPGLLSEMMGL